MNTTQRKKRPFLRRVALVTFLSCLATIVGIAGAIALIYNAQTLSHDKLNVAGNQLIIYDASGELIPAENVFNCIRISDLPPTTRNAFIAVEDKNFHKHSGVSYERIAKATYKNLRARRTKEGASTITQQLVKNTHLSSEKTMQRKLREASLAHKLEQHYTKDQILEMYLNVIYFGNNINGLEVAANTYFGKTASDLTTLEGAALAGMIRNPARYCPVYNFDNFCKRGLLAVDLMKAQGYLTDEQYDSARAETLTVKPLQRTKSPSWFYRRAAASEAAEILHSSVAELQSSGIKIHTYYDPEIQAAIDEVINANDYRITNVSNRPTERVVISATPSGQINGYYTSTPVLTGARRNFASALKPLTVYAPALELGVISPATIVVDEDFVSGDFRPRNHDNKYRGKVSASEALEQSYNVPAVKILNYTRLDRSINIARTLGLNLTDEENLSVALGNTKNGITFNEVVGGYCTIANGGIKTKPSMIKKITASDGRVLYERLPTQTRVLGEDTTFILREILRRGTKNGTAKAMGSLPFDVAAKTGTAERGEGAPTNTDAINCSLTNEGVLLVWAGNATMLPEHDLPKGTTGGGTVSFIARDIQKKINREAKPFEIPVCIQKCEIDMTDVVNGKVTLATQATPKNKRKSEYFSIRYMPTTSSTNFVRPVGARLSGRIGETGAPTLSFDTVPHQTYQIFKIDNGTSKLMEVVKNNAGEYIFADNKAAKGKICEYFVETSLGANCVESVTSNTVKLYTAQDINEKASSAKKKKLGSGKSWLF
jgi:membrane peptidoglycan carboxypeptidase